MKLNSRLSLLAITLALIIAASFAIFYVFFFDNTIAHFRFRGVQNFKLTAVSNTRKAVYRKGNVLVELDSRKFASAFAAGTVYRESLLENQGKEVDVTNYLVQPRKSLGTSADFYPSIESYIIQHITITKAANVWILDAAGTKKRKVGSATSYIKEGYCVEGLVGYQLLKETNGNVILSVPWCRRLAN